MPEQLPFHVVSASLNMIKATSITPHIYRETTIIGLIMNINYKNLLQTNRLILELAYEGRYIM